MAYLHDMLNAVSTLKPHETAAIGQTTKLVAHLDPVTRDGVIQMSKKYNDQISMGRHGNPDKVAEDYGLNDHVLGKLHEGIRNDLIASELQARKGTDANLPDAPPSRRDAIEIAFQAHNQE